MKGLATLLEGAGLAFYISKLFKVLNIKFGCFEAVWLTKEVFKVIYS